MAHAQPIRRQRTYVVVWLLLLGLALISFAASRSHLGAVDIYIALGIAGAKTALVAWFFMGLAEERVASRMVFVATVIFMVLVVSLTALDVATRHTFPKGTVPIRVKD